jgi:hypothetical protein
MLSSASSLLLLLLVPAIFLIVEPAGAQLNADVSTEGFFLNGSSYAIISDTLSLSGGAMIGLSFRTCTPGELLKQLGDSYDQLELRVSNAGRLVLRVTTGDDGRSLDVVVGSDLLDGRWHTVALNVAQDSSKITVTVRSPGRNDDVAYSEQSDVLRNVALSASSPQLRVGAGMVACIREGPGVRFTKSGVAVHSAAVSWDQCLLPYTCSGRNFGNSFLCLPSFFQTVFVFALVYSLDVLILWETTLLFYL